MGTLTPSSFTSTCFFSIIFFSGLALSCAGQVKMKKNEYWENLLQSCLQFFQNTTT